MAPIDAIGLGSKPPPTRPTFPLFPIDYALVPNPHHPVILPVPGFLKIGKIVGLPAQDPSRFLMAPNYRRKSPIMRHDQHGSICVM